MLNIDFCENRKRQIIINHLESLKWDGQARYDKLFSHYCNLKNSEYLSEVSKLLFMWGLNRIYSPGENVYNCIVIEGESSSNNKQRLIDILSFGFTSIIYDDIDFNEVSQLVKNTYKYWFVTINNIDEYTQLDTHRNFIGRCHDTTRLPYTREAKTYERSFIFIGITNEKKYLRKIDKRILPINLKKINFDNIEFDINQIWAEALYYYKQITNNGKVFFNIPSNLDASIEELQKERLLNT